MGGRRRCRGVAMLQQRGVGQEGDAARVCRRTSGMAGTARALAATSTNNESGSFRLELTLPGLKSSSPSSNQTPPSNRSHQEQNRAPTPLNRPQ